MLILIVSIAVAKELVNVHSAQRISIGTAKIVLPVPMVYFLLLVQPQKTPVEALVIQDVNTTLGGITQDVIHAKLVIITLMRNASLVAKANLLLSDLIMLVNVIVILLIVSEY